MSHRFRKAAPLGPLLMSVGINALLLALVDGQKRTYYMIHVIPPLDALLLAWVLWVMTESRRKIAVALVLGCCACVQTALHVSRIRTDAYHREYLAAVAFIREHLDSRTKLVFAPPEYGFELGFGPIVHHDRTFGFYSGKVADVIVTTQFQNRDLSEASDLPAPIVRHIGTVISGYDLAYNESWAQVFLAKHRLGGSNNGHSAPPARYAPAFAARPVPAELKMVREEK
jgi:hypothetical protein